MDSLAPYTLINEALLWRLVGRKQMCDAPQSLCMTCPISLYPVTLSVLIQGASLQYEKASATRQ